MTIDLGAHRSTKMPEQKKPELVSAPMDRDSLILVWQIRALVVQDDLDVGLFQYDGPVLFAHVGPDGAYSFEDAAARADVRQHCASGFLEEAEEPQVLLDRAICARMLGRPMVEIVAAWNAHCERRHRRDDPRDEKATSITGSIVSWAPLCFQWGPDGRTLSHRWQIPPKIKTWLETVKPL